MTQFKWYRKLLGGKWCWMRSLTNFTGYKWIRVCDTASYWDENWQ